jgi:hypothetical protein
MQEGPLGRDRMIFFHADDYQGVLGTGNTADLPTVTTEEVLSLVSRLRFPDPHSALYREPEKASDPLGQHLLKDVSQSLTQEQSLTIGHGIEDWLDIRIGLNLPDFPEACWKVGRSQHGFSIYLDCFPCFPIWLTSETLSKVLKANLE